ncbi:glutathione S-transferase [Schizopora paradoxa]|uniref:glutathione transferase n=1 Tax=Schizopora paradoxa TaxID=27342 RepID=A0A0H2RY23_9AGAM|nr:glutathione S-transferase [Schizopora paradoxa]
MAIKIYGSAMATCTQRVLVTAKQLGVPVEVVGVDFAAKEHKSAEYLKKHPFGQIPYLDDDGFILFESRAIARYLSAAHGDGKLVPKGVKENALFEQAISIENNDFDPHASKLVAERIFGPLFRGTVPDETVASQKQTELEAKLDAYEVILGKYKYLGGNELTLADLFHLPYGTKATLQLKPGAPALNLEDPKRPNVARWWEEISSLPAWKEVQAEEQVAVAAIKKA